MSFFSDALKKSFEENKINRTHLAYVTGIDRTTIQHFINGRRMPRKDQWEAIRENLSVSPRERENLNHEYKIAVDGVDVVRQREKVKTIIEKIAMTPALNLNHSVFSLNDRPPHHPVRAVETEDLYGSLAINNALIRILQEEKEEVTFFMPHNYSFFYNTLFAQYTMTPTQKVVSLMAISNAKKRTMINLDYLEMFIPFFISAKHDFQAYYVYSDSGFPHDNTIVPFPYFVYTSRYVLALSSEMDRGFLTKTGSIMRAYKNAFRSFLSIAHPLYHMPTLPELVASYPRHEESVEFHSLIASQPYFQMYLDQNWVEKNCVVNSEEDALLVRQYADFLKTLKAGLHFSVAFTQEGLDAFVETGRIQMLPPSLVNPLDIPDRVNIMRLLLNDIQNNELKCRLVNTSKFTIPHKTTHVSVLGRTLTIEHLDYDTPNVKIIHLTEEFIVEAFSEFTQYLPGTDFLHSKSETVKAFEAALEKLEAMETA